MVYVNYYSKIRNRIGMSDAELEREIKYNTNRVVTKEVPNNTARIQDTHLRANTVLENRIESFIFNHPITITNTAFVDARLAIYRPYYYDFKQMYETFNIPKRSGGYREICAPNDELKALQRELANTFTKTMKFLPHNAAHGFTKKRNCKTSLEIHKAHGARWFLKMDIKDFFPNTTFEKILEAMNTVYPFCNLTEKQKWLYTCVCTLSEHTPQGAPTSPIITNMVMVANDVKITKYCKEKGFTYTRYADDILISSPVHFDWQTVQQEIARILTGYELKQEKTRYGNFNGRNWNLGLMYNNQNEITVGHAKKKLVKNLVHNYKTKQEYQTIENWYKLLGTIGYCYYIEPEYFKDYLDYIKANPPA